MSWKPITGWMLENADGKPLAIVFTDERNFSTSMLMAGAQVHHSTISQTGDVSDWLKDDVEAALKCHWGQS